MTSIATKFEISREQSDPYFKLRDAFAALSECAAIWDVKSHQATDQFRERTTAEARLDRERIGFSLGICDLIRWAENVPHLQNANGGDLFLYPGFVLYRGAKEAFSIIDYHDVKGKVVPVRFQEEDSVPKDAKVIGQTWAKANKDGSRDKRFADNHPIPIVLYASLTLKSNSGLWEEFQFSSVERIQNFAEALNTFVSSFGPSPETVATHP